MKTDRPVEVTQKMMEAGAKVLAESGLFDTPRPLLFPSFARDVYLAMKRVEVVRKFNKVVSE